MSKQSGAEEGYRVLSYLLSGLLLYGGLGWLADHFMGTTLWLPIGLVIGTGCGIYLVIKRHADPSTPRTEDDPDVNPDGKEIR